MWKEKPHCNNCSLEFEEPYLRCPECNSLLIVSTIKGPAKSEITLSSMWSLRDFLPDFSKIITLAEGNTPFLQISRDQDLKELNVKLEFRNPTGTFRDRACSLIVSDAVQKKAKTIVGASTGSFSISLSAYAAKAGLSSTNVVPQNLELSKIEQMKIYGGLVIEKGETVDEAIKESEIISAKEKGYFATPEQNILTIEGQKTIGLEIALQSEKIDSIIVPRGSGSLIFSIYRGFEDAKESGWIKKIPRLYSISLEKTKIAHLAESLEMKKPYMLEEVQKLVKETDGKEIEIDAGVMIDEALTLARQEGLFIEPSSASVIAAARILTNERELDSTNTVAILTGSGFNALNIYAAQLRGKKKVVWGLSESSTTKFEILNLIAGKKATYGYSVWVSLGKSQSLQSIYQHLNELTEKGLITEIETEKKRKEFELTKKGYETIEKMRDLIDYV
ncbi:MAG: pyridoxal-phosphate dependent enzyme [Candidatus Heimdallarchaeota archaeon]|nr:pyridoxal-phosphate dependent enzyme [Candidatus Heimdallarchaeota archaeon]MCK4770906.1 pyridoxal-phosphate dependent enzyme [Candidatus Heimdallarchaeota archaeon]